MHRCSTYTKTKECNILLWYGEKCYSTTKCYIDVTPVTEIRERDVLLRCGKNVTV